LKAITIVTVCYNEEKNIARTIESVLMQTAMNFEYIICDGLSQDHTVAIAESYREAFSQKGISYRIFSEKDCGIYDAMNKGIDKAEGSYIWFLNAGDWLCAADVLEKFVSSIEKDTAPAVYYADFYIVEDHLQKRRICNADNMKRSMSVGHPSMVARMDFMRARKFDTAYRLAADYNFVLGLVMDGLEFRKLDFPASCFMVGGISSTNKELEEEEVSRIHKHYGLPHEPAFFQKIPLVRRIINKLIKLAPKSVWKFWCVKIKRRPWVEY